MVPTYLVVILFRLEASKRHVTYVTKCCQIVLQCAVKESGHTCQVVQCSTFEWNSWRTDCKLDILDILKCPQNISTGANTIITAEF